MAFSPDRQQRLLFISDLTNNHIWFLNRADGKVLGQMGSMGENGGQWFGLHMIAVDSKGNIYTGEVFNGERVQRFVPADSPRGKLLDQARPRIESRRAAGEPFASRPHGGGTVGATATGIALMVLAYVVLPGVLTADPRRLQWSILTSLAVYNRSTLLGGPLGEEPGWRGYALPRLEQSPRTCASLARACVVLDRVALAPVLVSRVGPVLRCGFTFFS